MKSKDNRGITGQACLTGGRYYCYRHVRSEISLTSGSKFPPCAFEGFHSTTWILIPKTKRDAFGRLKKENEKKVNEKTNEEEP